MTTSPDDILHLDLPAIEDDLRAVHAPLRTPLDAVRHHTAHSRIPAHCRELLEALKTLQREREHLLADCDYAVGLIATYRTRILDAEKRLRELGEHVPPETIAQCLGLTPHP